MVKTKMKRYQSINIYGEPGKIILASSLHVAIRKAPKNSLEVHLHPAHRSRKRSR